MNAEYLLDAIGLLDDGLIQEAEAYTIPRRQPDRRAWMGWAACLAIAVCLLYGASHIRMGGGSPASGNAPNAGGSLPSASSAGTMSPEPPSPEANGGVLGSGDGSASTPPPSAEDPESPGEGDFCAAIMVDGVLYWSTGIPVPGEVEESAIRTVTSYTDGQPEEDGQTNFDRSLTTWYAMTDMGLVVLMDREWVLFDPVPPWERQAVN